MNVDDGTSSLAKVIPGAAVVLSEISFGGLSDGEDVVGLGPVALEDAVAVGLDLVAVLEPLNLRHARVSVDDAGDIGLDAQTGVVVVVKADALADALLVVLDLWDVCGDNLVFLKYDDSFKRIYTYC